MLLPHEQVTLSEEEARVLVEGINKLVPDILPDQRRYDKLAEVGLLNVYQGLRSFLDVSKELRNCISSSIRGEW